MLVLKVIMPDKSGNADAHQKRELSITIVIPVFNEESHLKACLDSIAAQTEMPDEVLVINNNSTDKTVKIAESYSFVTILHEKRQGIVYTRDTGFNAVKSDIIGRIDGDSILPKDWVERVLAFYSNGQNERAVLTGGGYFYNISNPAFNGWVFSQLAYRMNRFITGYYIAWGSNMALRREHWLRVRDKVCRDNALHEDLDLAIHLNRAGFPITYSATLRVGAYMKRVWENASHQNEHLRRWPNTLKRHGFPLWWLSIAGNILVKYVAQPYALVTEFFMRRYRKYDKAK